MIVEPSTRSSRPNSPIVHEVCSGVTGCGSNISRSNMSIRMRRLSCPHLTCITTSAPLKTRHLLHRFSSRRRSFSGILQGFVPPSRSAMLSLIEPVATSIVAGCVHTSPGGVTWIRSTKVLPLAVECTEKIS